MTNQLISNPKSTLMEGCADPNRLRYGKNFEMTIASIHGRIFLRFTESLARVSYTHHAAWEMIINVLLFPNTLTSPSMNFKRSAMFPNGP